MYEISETDVVEALYENMRFVDSTDREKTKENLHSFGKVLAKIHEDTIDFRVLEDDENITHDVDVSTAPGHLPEMQFVVEYCSSYRGDFLLMALSGNNSMYKFIDRFHEEGWSVEDIWQNESQLTEGGPQYGTIMVKFER